MLDRTMPTMPTARTLATLHATAFDGAARWSTHAFVQALADPTCFLVLPDEPSDAFALGRTVADEAEVMTLVVAPHRRQTGIGRDLLARFDALAVRRGAAAAFLEVAATNRAARALYARAGWREVGRRPGYYAGVDALTLRKDLAVP